MKKENVHMFTQESNQWATLDAKQEYLRQENLIHCELMINILKVCLPGI